MDRQRIGKEAEQAALQYLQRQGLLLIQQNYLCRLGEIDLIMQDQQQLVFIEVRKRSHRAWGGAVASVDYHKQQRLIKTANLFLSQHRQHRDKTCRFDVIAFESDSCISSGDSCPIWYKDAFRPEATF